MSKQQNCQPYAEPPGTNTSPSHLGNVLLTGQCAYILGKLAMSKQQQCCQLCAQPPQSHTSSVQLEYALLRGGLACSESDETAIGKMCRDRHKLTQPRGQHLLLVLQVTSSAAQVKQMPLTRAASDPGCSETSTISIFCE